MAQRRFRAILIGNGLYEKDASNLLPLKGPANDVRLLEAALTHPKLGLHRPEDVECLVDCTSAEIRTRLNEFFVACSPEDQLFVYYSGHGKLDLRNTLYLCARDTRTDLLHSTAVDNFLINTLVENCCAPATVIVLDCCHSGGFKGSDIPENLKGRGRFVLTSCQSEELARDGSESPFTRFFSEALLEASADSDKDGYVTLNEVYNHLRPRLHAASGQIPQRHFDHVVGEVVLMKVKPEMPFPAPLSSRPPDPPPLLSVSPERIDLDEVKAGERLPAEIVDVCNEGGGTIDWFASCDEGWVELRPEKGYLEIILTPKDPGVNRANVHVRDRGKGGRKTVRITVTVREGTLAPLLVVSPEAVDFGALPTGTKNPVPQVVRLINKGGGELHPSIDVTGEGAIAKLVHDAVEILPDTSRPRTIDARVRVRSRGGERTIPVRGTVESLPTMALKPAKRLDFGALRPGETKSLPVEVWNSGSGQLVWSCEREGAFFEVEKEANRAVVTISDAEPGTHRGTLRVRSNGGDRSVEVVARVEKAGPEPGGAPAVQDPWSGQWVIDMNAFGLATSRFVLQFMPNGQIAGNQSLFGITMALQGQWAFDPANNVLMLNLWVAGASDTLAIQLVEKRKNGYLGRDMIGRQYSLTRA